MLVLLLFVCFFLLLLLRVPIAFALGIVSAGFLTAHGEVLLVVPQRMSATVDSFPLLAIPFYILMGKLVNEAGVTERIFGWPGMGRLFLDHVERSDTAVVMGILMMIALAVIIFQIIADVMYAWLDPRIRYK